MIRTRYCSAQSYPEFKAELESKGHEVVMATTMSGVTQVTYKVAGVVEGIFEDSLLQLRNGNMSEEE